MQYIHLMTSAVSNKQYVQIMSTNSPNVTTSAASVSKFVIYKIYIKVIYYYLWKLPRKSNKESPKKFLCSSQSLIKKSSLVITPFPSLSYSVNKSQSEFISSAVTTIKLYTQQLVVNVIDMYIHTF